MEKEITGKDRIISEKSAIIHTKEAQLTEKIVSFTLKIFYVYYKAEIERVKGQVKEQARKENKTLSKLVQQFYELNASEVQSIDRKKELLKLAGETGLIENPIQSELDEIQARD